MKGEDNTHDSQAGHRIPSGVRTPEKECGRRPADSRLEAAIKKRTEQEEEAEVLSGTARAGRRVGEEDSGRVRVEIPLVGLL